MKVDIIVNWTMLSTLKPTIKMTHQMGINKGKIKPSIVL